MEFGFYCTEELHACVRAVVMATDARLCDIHQTQFLLRTLVPALLSMRYFSRSRIFHSCKLSVAHDTTQRSSVIFETRV